MAGSSKTKVGRWTALYLLCAALIGAAGGLGLFTFGYADGAAYLTNRPEACANCHVMRDQLDAWVKSSHGKFATCNDCHAPHSSLAAKYYCKARNGFFHSLAFTTDRFPDQILITDYNRNVVEESCRHCHQAIVDQIDHGAATAAGEAASCIRCHATVGHDT